MNNVNVTLGLKDQLTSPLRGVMSGVRSELRSIGDTSQALVGGIGSMATSFLGVAAAIGAAGIALVGFQGGITKAAAIETSMITSAGDVANLVGTTYTEALASVKDIQKEVVKMAASLPGETAGFAAIANSVTASIALGSKGNLKTMKADVLEVTKTLGLLAATKGVDMNMAASASNKFVSGSSSIAELFGTNDVFQKNPLFKVYLNEQLKALGKTSADWEKLDQTVRNKVIVAAGKRAFTAETLKKFDGTADSLIQSIKTSLFDPQVGIFGFLREIKELDGQTALSRVAVFLGLVQDVAESLGKAGFNFDPMLEIGKSLNYLSDVLYVVNIGITSGDWKPVKQMLANMWKGVKAIPLMLGNGMNTLIDMFKTIDWKVVSGYVAEGLDAITAGIKVVKWGELGASLGKGIMDILLDEKLGIALEKSVSAALQGLADAIAGAIKEATKTLLGKDGVKAVKDTAAGITNVGINTDGVSLGKKAGNFLGGEINKLFGGTGNETKPLPELQSNNSNNKGQAGTFAPVVNITGTVGDSNDLVTSLMSALSEKFTEYKQGVIA